MLGDKETLSGFYKSPQVLINTVLSICNQVWCGSILSINKASYVMEITYVLNGYRVLVMD